MRKNAGFSLIELLTVIAIIGVLAGMIFPVFAGMRKHAGEGQCMTNLHMIWSAVRQYRQDEGEYPDQILSEYVGSDSSGREVHKVVGLYPEYLRALRYFNCPQNPNKSARAEDMTLTSGGTIRAIPLSAYDGMIADGKYERHYCKDWDVADTDADYRRQLKERYPREDTVVTWCSYHRSGPNFTPQNGDVDLFLWLNGHVQKVGSASLGDEPWRTEPTAN